MRYLTNLNACLVSILMLYCCIVPIACGWDEATIYKKKVTREEALPLFNEPLPASARNIYCYMKAEGMQGLTRFARLDVDPAELQSAVETIIAHNNTAFRRSLPFERRELSMIPEEHVGTPRSLSKEAKLEWWNPERITRGYYRGEMDSFAVRLWIDEENAQIYLFQLD